MSVVQPTIRQIADLLERTAPLSLQESYDNCGLIVGDPSAVCTGALLTVDVTPDIVREAADAGCNLIVAHHPLIFHGLKHLLVGGSAVEQAVIAALRAGIAVYACHTALDNAPSGVSARMAAMLGLTDAAILAPDASGSAGSGVVASLPSPVTASRFVQLVKAAFGSPVARCSAYDMDAPISRVALCGGSGAFLIPQAIAAGAQAFVTSDTKYHDFVDNARRILIVDIGHHESENCTKDIFYHVIKEKFPNFAVRYARLDVNPIIYL